MNVKSLLRSDGDILNKDRRPDLLTFLTTIFLRISFACIIALPFSAFAQYQVVKPAISGKRYPPSVTRVAEDSHGFIWYLTNDGLYRYDGQRSVYFKKELKALGFTGTPTEMLIDTADHIWLASRGCFAFLDIKSWKMFKAPSNFMKPKLANEILKMEELPGGKIFVGYRSGYVLTGSTRGFKKIDELYKRTLPSGRPLSYASGTYWKSHYWISTDYGRLFRIDTTLKPATVKMFILTNEKSSIIKLMPWRDKLICKSLDGGLYDFDGNKATKLTKGDFAFQTHLNRLQDEDIQIGESYLYLTKRGPARKEFFVFSSETTKHTILYIDSLNVLSDAYISNIKYNKHSGTIFLGTSQGIYILVKNLPKIAQFSPFAGIANRSVRGIYRFPDGEFFYAGYSGSGLSGKKRSFRSTVYRAIYSMLPLNNHQLLLGSEGGGLKQFDKNTLIYSEVTYHMKPDEEPLLSKFVFCMAFNNGRYYCGTLKGIWVFDPVNRQLSMLRNNKDEAITSGLQIKRLLWYRGQLYIACQNGLYRWSGGQLIQLYPRGGLNQGVYDVVADERGLWLATINEGMIHLDHSGREIGRLNTETGLNTNVIFTLLNTGEMLIAGTDRGLILMKKDSIRLLGEEDGLQQLEFNHGASFYDAKSKIAYMGGLGGYTKLDVTREWFKNEPPKPVFIGTASINGRNQSDNREIYNLSYAPDLKIKLNAGQEYLSIAVATPLSYAHRYDPEYKFTGVSDHWQRLEEGQPVSLLGLEPGSYALRIRAAESFKPDNMLELGIQKMPEFYQTWWFRGVLILLAAGLIYLGYRNRIQKVRQESMLRTRIASDLHDEVGGILTGISLQADFLLYHTAGNNQPYLKQIAESGREAILTMGDIVWSVDSRNDNTAELLIRMRDYLSNMLEPKGIKSHFFHSEYYPAIPQLIRQNTYLIFKEAINNISKHANATQVEVSMTWENKLLKLLVTDDGAGINPDQQAKGQGLNNMKMRARRMKARLLITPGQPGTMITLEVPLTTK